jgi:Flp pilus assembly protein TadD
MKPENAGAHHELAVLLHGQGKFAAAGNEYQKVLELEPGNLAALNNLTWLLATCPEASVRNGERAVELARRRRGLPGARSRRFWTRVGDWVP